MRRALVGLVVISFVAALAGFAEAGSPKIRLDPNDSPYHTDIRRVVSDLSESTVYLRIDSWQKVQFRSMYYIIRLDASGNRGFDRVVEIFPNYGSGGFNCIVEVSEPGGDPGAIVGQQPASRPNSRSVGCSLPRSWFPRIQRAVRFYVRDGGEDRAPNKGLFVWL